MVRGLFPSVYLPNSMKYYMKKSFDQVLSKVLIQKIIRVHLFFFKHTLYYPCFPSSLSNCSCHVILYARAHSLSSTVTFHEIQIEKCGTSDNFLSQTDACFLMVKNVYDHLK